MAKAPNKKSILLPPAHLFAITYDYFVSGWVGGGLDGRLRVAGELANML